MADTIYRVWDDDGNVEEDGEDLMLFSGPREAAAAYCEGNHSDLDYATSVDVSVRNKSTNELTRWTVTVDYEPTFTARPRAIP